MENCKHKFATHSLHAGHNIDSDTLSRAIPIYQTTSYVFKDNEHALKLFNLEEFGNIYSRLSNPTTDVLEKRLAILEDGVGALCTSSGQAAIFLSLITLLKSGDEFISSSDLYGGTYNLFRYSLRRLGITTHFINIDELPSLEHNILSKAGAIFLETIPNPSLKIPDFDMISSIARKYEIPVIVDNTVATPYLCNPKQFGADIVVHSATKYISGHGTTMGGVIVDTGNYNWNTNKYSELSEPNPNYHGVIFTDKFKELAFLMKARLDTMRDIGCCLSPFNAFQIIQGLETLPLRMKKQCDNALDVAKYLSSHPNVEWFNYPILDHEKNRMNSRIAYAEKYLKNGYGAIVSFGVKGGYEKAVAIINRVKLFSFLANIGDAKSLIIHPASSTHHQLTDEERISAGVPNELIRLSIGAEDISDILDDLKYALDY